MKHQRIKTIAALLGVALLFVACSKENSDLLVGQWTNTAQSYEITIAGKEDIPEGYLCMKFTDSKVLASDYRKDCLAKWHRYTLKEESGKHILEINQGCIGGLFIVEKVTSDELVLAPFSSGADWDFRYIMKRHEGSWPD